MSASSDFFCVLYLIMLRYKPLLHTYLCLQPECSAPSQMSPWGLPPKKLLTLKAALTWTCWPRCPTPDRLDQLFPVHITAYTHSILQVILSCFLRVLAPGSGPCPKPSLVPASKASQDRNCWCAGGHFHGFDNEQIPTRVPSWQDLASLLHLSPTVGES